MIMSYYAKQSQWLETAAALQPTLFMRNVMPRRMVSVEPDATAFQGWQLADRGSVQEACAQVLGRDFDLTFDFGEHLVGHVRFALDVVGIIDCPFRMKITFGEMPAEIAEDFENYQGILGRGWLQEEVLTLDYLSGEIELSRRYAFRYVRVRGQFNAPAYKVRLRHLECVVVTSADEADVPELSAGIPASLRQLDRIAQNTLRDCMQGIFEDGPKRDRRLWLGDFRLQALTNYHSFRNFDLAKRCLYLFAGLADANGRVPTCLYDLPTPHPGESHILDYVAIFATSLLEYAQASGDWDSARELWPVALRQTEIARAEISPDGLFRDQAKWLLFIDWHAQLDKQAAEQAVMIFALKQTYALGVALKREAEVAELAGFAETMSRVAMAQLFDSTRGVFVSGEQRQVSWASQAWMTLAGVIRGPVAAKAIRAAMADPAAIKPAGPYLYHFVVEAMLLAGMDHEAWTLLETYWGAMARLGADTFWEVFDPANPLLSPYGSHLMNSYCHAWSCTPAYFLRRPDGAEYNRLLPCC